MDLEFAKMSNLSNIIPFHIVLTNFEILTNMEKCCGKLKIIILIIKIIKNIIKMRGKDTLKFIFKSSMYL